MNFNWNAAIRLLGETEIVRFANQARTPGDYFLARYLPELSRPTYDVSAGEMIVRATMAGLAAMDSPYPGGAYIEAGVKGGRTFKMGNSVPFSEGALRELQAQIATARGQDSAAGNPKQLAQEVLNFFEYVILQGHFDAVERMRGEILTTGRLTLETSGKVVDIDYGVPAANLFATRTIASGEAYSGASSAFWTDYYSAISRLGDLPQAVLCHPHTALDIVENPANNLRIVSGSEEAGVWELERWVNNQGNTQVSEDRRDRVTLMSYGLGGEVLDKAGNTTQKVDFMPRGYVTFIGRPGRRPGYMVGQGTQGAMFTGQELGYVHVGPTVENGGQPGRWGRVYTPEQRPYQLIGEGVANLAPVITAPEKIVVASTELVDRT